MEITILQNVKDSNPQTVRLEKVVESIRNSNWPVGYQPVVLIQGVFEGGIHQQNLTQLSGLSVAAVTRG